MESEAARKQALFQTTPIPYALAAMALPAIISQLITLAYNLADSYFVGRTGNAYMVAAVALVYPVFSMTVALSNLFGVGGSSLISRLLGSGREEEARGVCGFSIYAAAGAALLFSVLALLLCEPLLMWLGAAGKTAAYAETYMYWSVVLGTVPTVVSATQAYMLRSVGYARQAGFGLSMGAILNILLDPLFIFVLFPRGKEIVGAAAATLVSNWLAVLYFSVMIGKLRGKTILTLSPADIRLDRKHLHSILTVGLSSAVTVLLYDIATVRLTGLMAAFGDYQLAALGIVLKAERLPLNTGVGLCQGMLPLAAYNYSNKNYKRMYGTTGFARLCGLCVAGGCILLYLTMSEQIVRQFISGAGYGAEGVEETVAFAARFLKIRCLSTPFAFMNFHITYSFQAMGDGRTTLCLAILRQCVFYIPAMLLLGRWWGADGLAGAQLVSELVTLCTASVIYFSRKRTLLCEKRGD